MRILANDIGGLTQDILLFDSTQTIENCVKMIMPSPASNLARKIRSATTDKQSIFFTGVNMGGGGPTKRALIAHLKNGAKAYATIQAAATFDDDLNQVAKMGVNITNPAEAPEDAICIETRDLDLDAIEKALSAFEVDTSLDAIAIAVLDHGAAPPGVSDRVFRFQHLQKTVEEHQSLLDFAYLSEEIPDYLTRMKSVALSLDRDIPLLVMDTPVAAAIGAIEDPIVNQNAHRVIVNIGNFHTLAFHLEGDTILGFFEHHTGMIDTFKIDHLVTRLIEGKLTNIEVYNDKGHGCFICESRNVMPFVTVTGPQRHIMKASKLNPYFAAPHGDMMLTGCFGLVTAYKHKTRPES